MELRSKHVLLDDVAKVVKNISIKCKLQHNEPIQACRIQGDMQTKYRLGFSAREPVENVNFSDGAHFQQRPRNSG